ncbi:MAG: cytochrome o ubiquinol oxidase subunit IV [Sphingomonadaceae bacterium]
MTRTEPEIPFYRQRPQLKDYITGFLLAVVLTVLPFWVVYAGGVSRGGTLVFIAICAIVQMGVHLRFFMHYSTRRVPKEASIALTLAIFIGGIIIAGAIWVMYDLNYRMMGG